MNATLCLKAMTSGTLPPALATAMLALAAAGFFAPQALAQERAVVTAAVAVQKTIARPTQISGIDGRVQLLAKELDLDDSQQVQVRKILARQRADVSQVWSNEAMPAQVQVASTRAIGERTAESIRAILSDKQRARYNKAQPAPPTVNSMPSGDAWGKVLGGK